MALTEEQLEQLKQAKAERERRKSGDDIVEAAQRDPEIIAQLKRCVAQKIIFRDFSPRPKGLLAIYESIAPLDLKCGPGFCGEIDRLARNIRLFLSTTSFDDAAEYVANLTDDRILNRLAKPVSQIVREKADNTVQINVKIKEVCSQLEAQLDEYYIRVARTPAGQAVTSKVAIVADAPAEREELTIVSNYNH